MSIVQYSFFLVFIVCSLLSTPLKNISFTWKLHHSSLGAVKSRSLLYRYPPWAGRYLYRAKPAVTRKGIGFFGLKSQLYDKSYCGLIIILPLEFLFTETTDPTTINENILKSKLKTRLHFEVVVIINQNISYCVGMYIFFVYANYSNYVSSKILDM